MMMGLTVGERRLSEDKFDSLITVAGESVAEASRDLYLELLTSIARSSNASGGANVSELCSIDNRQCLLDDMEDREVIARDVAGRLSIRVGLFAEWLRRNR